MSVFAGPEIPNSGLVLHLDAGNTRSYSGSGTTWADISGNGNNGTTTSMPTYSSGALTFDGATNFVSVASPITLGATSFTVSCWLKYTLSQTFIDIINNRDSATAYSGFLLTTDYVSKSGKIRVQLNNSTTVNSYTSSGATIADGTYKYVAVAVDRTSNVLSFYVNGALDATFNIATIGDITSTSNFVIGRDYAFNDPKAWFAGTISIVSVYSRALSQSEVSQVFVSSRSRHGV